MRVEAQKSSNGRWMRSVQPALASDEDSSRCDGEGIAGALSALIIHLVALGVIALHIPEETPNNPPEPIAVTLLGAVNLSLIHI